VMVHGGRLRIGTSAAPHRHRATVTLTDVDRSRDVHEMGTRGIFVMGGVLELVSADEQATFTKLAASSADGATSIRVLDPRGFRVGDRIAVAPTDFRAVGGTETAIVRQVSGSTLTLATPLERARFGVTQTFAGRVVDERAEVANLSRTIVVEGADDELFSRDGFGAHIMVMRGGAARFHGVELRRMGQRGTLARYPIHFHRMSYDDAGRSVGDATSSFVERSVISDSENRCIVVHGTNGMTVTDNVCHDIVGHAIFLEDAVERRTRIERNLVLGVRNPSPGDTLLVNESPIFQGGSSGFWITNPDNTVRNNVAVDCEGNGFWLAFPERALRLSRDVPMEPAYLPFGAFDDNVAHSNHGLGLVFDWVPVDDEGNVTPFKYQPFSGGTRGDESRRLDVVVSRFTAYKNEDGALWNRVERLRMRDFVLADHPDTMFRGSSTNCTIEGALVVGTTANSAHPAPADRPPSGAASYHSSCDIRHNTFVNLPFVDGVSSGAFRTDDYYVRAVDRGLVRNTDNTFIAAHPGFRTPLPRPDQYFVRASALWDPLGLWGAAGNYWVYDLPFLTNGTTCTEVAPAGRNGKSCRGPYYGVGTFYLDDTGDRFLPLTAIEVTRQDSSGAATAVFSVGDGSLASELGHMRHFAMLRGGRYVLRFPERAPPRSIEVAIENLQSSGDHAMLAIPYDGDIVPFVFATTWPNFAEGRHFLPGDTRDRLVRFLRPASSIEAVARGNGETFYRDSANDLVWIRVQGGLPFFTTPDPNSDEDLYRTVGYRIEPER